MRSVSSSVARSARASRLLGSAGVAADSISVGWTNACSGGGAGAGAGGGAGDGAAACPGFVAASNCRCVRISTEIGPSPGVGHCPSATKGPAPALPRAMRARRQGRSPGANRPLVRQCRPECADRQQLAVARRGRSCWRSRSILMHGHGETCGFASRRNRKRAQPARFATRRNRNSGGGLSVL